MAETLWATLTECRLFARLGYVFDTFLILLMIAIIRTGGKQYGVQEGEKITIEKIAGEAGETVVFSEVLLAGDDTSVKTGMPLVPTASVSAVIVEQGRADKVWGIKHKPKKRYKVKYGHRQPYTEVEIHTITA